MCSQTKILQGLEEALRRDTSMLNLVRYQLSACPNPLSPTHFFNESERKADFGVHLSVREAVLEGTFELCLFVQAAGRVRLGCEARAH